MGCTVGTDKLFNKIRRKSNPDFDFVVKLHAEKSHGTWNVVDFKKADQVHKQSAASVRLFPFLAGSVM